LSHKASPTREHNPQTSGIVFCVAREELKYGQEKLILDFQWILVSFSDCKTGDLHQINLNMRNRCMQNMWNSKYNTLTRKLLDSPTVKFSPNNSCTQSSIRCYHFTAEDTRWMVPVPHLPVVTAQAKRPGISTVSAMGQVISYKSTYLRSIIS